MDEWKELEIDNLPPDVLTGDYEVQFLNNNKDWVNYSVNGIYEIIEKLETGVADGIRYRKLGPKQPSHERLINEHIFAVSCCINSDRLVYKEVIKNAVLFLLESATIPPEGN